MIVLLIMLLFRFYFKGGGVLSITKHKIKRMGKA